MIQMDMNRSPVTLRMRVGAGRLLVCFQGVKIHVARETACCKDCSQCANPSCLEVLASASKSAGMW
jgi:hypothetical protein